MLDYSRLVGSQYPSDRILSIDKKNLHSFKGISCFENLGTFLSECETIFFEARTTMFRGGFIGFTKSLYRVDEIRPLRKTLFYHTKKELFLTKRKLFSLI